MLSDLFTEKSQFDWMLEALLEVYKSHPSEDEITLQYLIPGVCKATAVCGMVSNDMLFHPGSQVV